MGNNKEDNLLLNEKPITNISNYTLLINNILTEDKNWYNSTTMPWYRGQGDYNWHLTPSIYRNYRNGLYSLEREMLRDFKLAFHIITKNSFSEACSGKDNDISYMALMQHYGLPTRLLDWTESSLIALYFSVRDYSNEHDSVVWLLDGWSLNYRKEIFGEDSIPDETHPKIEDYLLPPAHTHNRKVKAENPIAIRAKKNNARLLAQKGHFTIHGWRPKPLNTLVIKLNAKTANHNQVYLKKIKISGKHKLYILRELYVAGISASVVFPEITGYCDEIMFRYSFDFGRKHPDIKRNRQDSISSR